MRGSRTQFDMAIGLSVGRITFHRIKCETGQVDFSRPPFKSPRRFGHRNAPGGGSGTEAGDLKIGFMMMTMTPVLRQIAGQRERNRPGDGHFSSDGGLAGFGIKGAAVIDGKHQTQGRHGRDEEVQTSSGSPEKRAQEEIVGLALVRGELELT